MSKKVFLAEPMSPHARSLRGSRLRERDCAAALDGCQQIGTRIGSEDEARDARSRELIASALAARDQDPSLAKLLAVEAMNVVATPTYQSTSVLHQVLAADPVIARYSWPKDRPGLELWTDLDPSGRLLVASGGGGNPTRYLEVADARTGKVLWSYPSAEIGSVSGFIGMGARVRFEPYNCSRCHISHCLLRRAG